METAAAQPCGLAGGGAMGEAKRPAKLHAWESVAIFIHRDIVYRTDAALAAQG
jgi:hypothetical protein